MKWFKHLSGSLSDPFIFDLIHRFGGDGYLVFFGVLEIYSREFKTEPNWKLTVTRAYLRQKLHKRQDTIIIKCLHFIATHGKLQANSEETPDELVTNSQQTPDKLPPNLKKVCKNSGKWDVEFNGNQLTIFIPKFTEVMDEWTAKKLRSKSGATPINLRHDKDKRYKIKEEDTINPPTPLKKIPYKAIVEAYHEVLPELPHIRKIGEPLKKSIGARWKDDKERQTLAWWNWYFLGIQSCDFLMGRKTDWRANLGWLCGVKNMDKVLNGAYTNAKNNALATAESWANEKVRE